MSLVVSVMGVPSLGVERWIRERRSLLICCLEKVGLARLKEALEAHDWSLMAADGEDEDLDFGQGGEDVDVAPGAELGDEALGLREPILAAEGQDHEQDEGAKDTQVEELESMILKMQAIKDMGADMPEAERKKFAAQAVRDVMRKL